MELADIMRQYIETYDFRRGGAPGLTIHAIFEAARKAGKGEREAVRLMNDTHDAATSEAEVKLHNDLALFQ